MSGTPPDILAHLDQIGADVNHRLDNLVAGTRLLSSADETTALAYLVVELTRVADGMGEKAIPAFVDFLAAAILRLGKRCDT